MGRTQLLKTIEQAYFGRLSFDNWRDAFGAWNLELMAPGGAVQFGKFREYFRWPDQIRTEFDFKDGNIINLFDGEKAWDGTGKPIDFDRFALGIRLRHLIHDLVIGKTKVVECEESLGRFKLNYGSEDQPSVTFDSKTGFLLKYEGPSRAMGRPNISTFEWSNYSVREGVPVPGKQNMLLNGMMFQRRELITFKMNPNHVIVSAAIIMKNNSVLLTRRKAADHLGGLWEFPGGKIHDGENLEACLRRELKEELGVEAKINSLFFSTVHDYPERTVGLHFYLCDIESGNPAPHEAEEMAWVRLADLEQYELPPADKELVAKLQGGVK